MTLYQIGYSSAKGPAPWMVICRLTGAVIFSCRTEELAEKHAHALERARRAEAEAILLADTTDTATPGPLGERD